VALGESLRDRYAADNTSMADVVGIFPDSASVIRLVGALLVEINDEMIAAERRYIAAASVAEIDGIVTDLRSLPAAPSD